MTEVHCHWAATASLCLLWSGSPRRKGEGGGGGVAALAGPIVRTVRLQPCPLVSMGRWSCAFSPHPGWLPDSASCARHREATYTGEERRQLHTWSAAEVWTPKSGEGQGQRGQQELEVSAQWEVRLARSDLWQGQQHARQRWRADSDTAEKGTVSWCHPSRQQHLSGEHGVAL